MATSTFTQLLTSGGWVGWSVVYVHRNRRFIRDGSTGHPPRLSTAPDLRRVGGLKCCFTSTETVGLLGTGAQDVHLDFHTAPGLCLLSRHRYEIAVCPGMQMQGVVQFMPHVWTLVMEVFSSCTLFESHYKGNALQQPKEQSWPVPLASLPGDHLLARSEAHTPRMLIIKRWNIVKWGAEGVILEKRERLYKTAFDLFWVLSRTVFVEGI